MRWRPFSIAATALAFQAGMPAAAADESDPDAPDMQQIEAECLLPAGIIRIVDGLIVFVAEALAKFDNPDRYREPLTCAFTRLGAVLAPDKVVFAATEAEVPEKVESQRRLAESLRLGGEREALVKRVVIALRSNDRAALAETKVIGKPYVSGDPDASGSRPAVPFTADSLGPEVACLSESPHQDMDGWYWVEWRCPQGIASTGSSTRTSFRFEGVEIAEIRTELGPPPIMMVVPADLSSPVKER